MPQWASSVVPEGALLRQINNKEQEKQHQHFKSSGGIPSSSLHNQNNNHQRPFSRGNLTNAEPSPLVSFAHAMEQNLNLKRQTTQNQNNHQRQWNSTSTNPVFHNQNNNNNNNNSDGNFLNNIQFSNDPVTMNMKQRALAANGTFGAKPHVIPMHLRSVVATLRRNVDEMKRFAAEIPILTQVEMPSATKRLAALLYAQTVAVDDLCRFTEDELKFASGKFYDLVSQMMELQCGKEDKNILETILNKKDFSSKNNNITKNEMKKTTSSSSTQTGSDERNDDNNNKKNQQQDDNEKEQEEESTSAGAATTSFFADQSVSHKLPETKLIRDLLIETSPSREIYESATQNLSPRTTSSLLGLAVRESQKELNSFRSLYSMLAGIANVTGASEGRLFLFPAGDLLATSRIYTAKLQQAQNEAKKQSKSKRTSNLFGDLGLGNDEDQDEQNEQQRKPPPKPKTVMESLDAEKLYLVAQVQASPFAPVRSATAPRDVVKIAEAVASTRCAANLTPGVARVRASFESLVAVPLFVSKQPESAVLGVLVLTNKRLAQKSSSSSSNPTTTTTTYHGKDENNNNNNKTNDARDNHNNNNIVSKLSSQNQQHNHHHSHFDNSASSSSWITRGFFHDDEHKAVIAAEMMSWLVEKVPTGVVMRGAVRLSPSGFAEEWSHWVGKPPSNFDSNSDNNNNNSSSSYSPVLDPQMALLQVPRRRFVFRTEDPREVAATGKLKLQSDRGFSQATTSSSGGGDVHVNSRRAQAENFAKMTKTRSLINPESGEYLINVAQSHRKMEEKTEELENEVAGLKKQMALIQQELEDERLLRRQAEDAAHSMQVACDRIVRKSIFANSGAGTHQTQNVNVNNTNNNSNNNKSKKNQQMQNQNNNNNKVPRPPSSPANNNNNTSLFEKDLSTYASASRPYSKTNVGIRPSSSSSSQHAVVSPTSRPSSSHSQHSVSSINSNCNSNTINNSSGELLTVAQIMAASNVPFNSQSNKVIPSFHAGVGEKEKVVESGKDGRKLSKVQKKVMNEEKKMYY